MSLDNQTSCIHQKLEENGFCPFTSSKKLHLKKKILMFLTEIENNIKNLKRNTISFHCENVQE